MAELAVVGICVNFWMPGVPPLGLCSDLPLADHGVEPDQCQGHGECEFWFAIIKVVAIIAMIGAGAWIVFFGAGSSVHATGVSNLWARRGFFPTASGA